MTITTHPHAHVLRAIAEGEQLQFKTINTQEWCDRTHTQVLDLLVNGGLSPDRFRVRPPIMPIIINGREVPKPLHELPPKGTTVYWPSFGIGADKDLVEHCEVGDYPTLLAELLPHGLLHSTKAGAAAHTQALISITKAR